ncbi:MAG TPA: hypothetical protein VGH34_17750 [Vicinamibacterales bacterium]
MWRDRYGALRTLFPRAAIHYAVKANPAAEVVAALAALGARFDVASRSELDVCLALGAEPLRISFGKFGGLAETSTSASSTACGRHATAGSDRWCWPDPPATAPMFSTSAPSTICH